MLLECQVGCCLIFTNPFETVSIGLAVHNYENQDFSKIRPTCTLFSEKGMSSDIIPLPSNCSPVSVVWDRHTKLRIMGHFKNLWAKLYEKIAEISNFSSKNPL